jgi:DNA primase
MEPLSASSKMALEEATARYSQALPAAVEYLRERGISLVTAERFRLGVVADPITGHEQYEGRLAIPYLGAMGYGHPTGIRFRALNGEEPKYLGIGGAATRLFNLNAIVTAGDSIHITEGELDAIILTQAGYHAVGVPGANAWKRHHPRLFAGFNKVFIWGDGDKAGQSFSRTVFESVDTGIIVGMPVGKDVNDLYLAEGEAGLHRALGLDDE